MGVSKNRGTPKSSILIGFSLMNHPFWGTTIFWKHPYCQKVFFSIRNRHVPVIFHIGSLIFSFCFLYSLRNCQQTPGIYPRYPKYKYERISFINKWLRVWGMFQGYVGVFLDTGIMWIGQSLQPKIHTGIKIVGFAEIISEINGQNPRQLLLPLLHGPQVPGNGHSMAGVVRVMVGRFLLTDWLKFKCLPPRETPLKLLGESSDLKSMEKSLFQQTNISLSLGGSPPP